MRPEILKGHLDGLLLSVLAAGPRHGYAVIEQLAASSTGVFDLPEGTVYPALHRLERDGLLTSRWSDESGRRRRVYELTRQGRRALEGLRAEWQGFSRAVTAVLQSART